MQHTHTASSYMTVKLRAMSGWAKSADSSDIVFLIAISHDLIICSLKIIFLQCKIMKQPMDCVEVKRIVSLR